MKRVFLFQFSQPIGQPNPSFPEDQYLMVGVEDIQLNLTETESVGKNEKAGWVTFDESPTEGGRDLSPMVEIGYEDLFKQTPDEGYLIVSPDRDMFKVTASDFVMKEENNDLNSSLLRDALSSMSLETQTLFTKSMKELDEPRTEQPNAYGDSCNPPHSFHPEVQNAEKKKRRPPPRPPPPSVNQGSVRKPPNVSLPPRGSPISKPDIPKNRPTLTSTAFNELKTNPAALSKKNPAQLDVNNDPFAELFKETRNGIAQNVNKN